MQVLWVRLHMTELWDEWIADLCVALIFPAGRMSITLGLSWFQAILLRLSTFLGLGCNKT